MLRHVSTIVLVLAALAAPTLLAASGPRADLADRPAAQRAFGATHATAGAPTALWAAEGAIIDPNGVTTTGTCQLDSCGDIGGVTDPNGLTAPAPRHPAASAPTALWAAQGSISDPNGVTTTGTCQPGTCGDEGAITDPDGLTATAPEPSCSLDLFLVWLRSLLSL